MTAKRKRSSPRRRAYSRMPNDLPLPSGLVWLDTVQCEPVRWLWPGFLPAGKLTLLEGPSNAGKSTLAREMAACITVGRALPGCIEASERAAVLWVSSEENAGQDIRPAIEAAGGDVSLVAVLRDDADWQPSMLGELATAIGEHAIALVVVDALKDHLANLGDEGETAVRAALQPWAKLARRTGAAIVGIRHWRKGAGPASERGAGSVAYRAVARHVLVVAPHEGCRVVAVDKRYRGEVRSLAFQIDDDGRVQWRGETPITADDLASWQPSKGDPTARASPAADDATSRMRAALLDGPRKATEVRAELVAAGVKQSTIDRARQSLGVVSEGAGRAVVWTLPTNNTTSGGG